MKFVSLKEYQNTSQKNDRGDIMVKKNSIPEDEINEIEEQVERKKKEAIKQYEKLIDRLSKERKKVADELDRDYREARQYVRSHPEEGVLYSFLGGLAIGYILGKIGRR